MTIIPRTYGPNQVPTLDPLFYDLTAHLWRGGSWAYFWNKQHRQSLWFPVGTKALIPLSWRRFLDVYFPVHPTGPAVNRGIYRQSSVTDVIAVNCLYADFDLKDWPSLDAILQHLAALPWPPSVVIFSGMGVHVYWLAAAPWLCSNPESRETIATLQHAWVHLVQADLTVHDLARILRVPGLLNHKYNPAPTVSILQFDLARLYQWHELLAAAADLVTQVGEQRRQWEQAGFEHSGGGRGATALLGDDAELVKAAMTWKTGAKLQRLWRGDTSDFQGDESRADQGLATLLAFATGRDANRIERLMRASGLYRDKWDRPGYLEQTILRAVYSCHSSYTPPSAEKLAAIEAAAGAVKGA